MGVEIIVKEDNNNLSFKKLIQIQKGFVDDGFSLSEYEKYIQDNIDNDYFHYRKLNDDDIKSLCKRYNNLLNKSSKDHSMSRKQRKLYRKKRHILCHEKRRELISDLIKEINHISVGDVSILQSDPEQWSQTKNLLFTGGTYLTGVDRKWCAIYQKIMSQNSAHLFNLNSKDDFVNYIYSQ